MRYLLIMFSMLALFSSPTHAAAGAAGRWTVAQRSGDVRVVRAGLQPASITVNQALAPGDTIVTGVSGRASLTRGGDYIVVAPRSQMRLPAQPERTGFTSIVQDLGTLLYKVRHTGVPHFSVDTPMLAAVVKGTTFTVVVDQDRSAVQVIDGLVEVTAADGGMQSLVHGGKTVFIERSNPKSLLTADAITLSKPGDGSGEAVSIGGSEGESVLSVTAATAGQVRMEAPKADATTRIMATAVVDSTAPVSTVLAAANGTTTSVLTPVSGLPYLTAPPASNPGVALPGISVPVPTTPSVPVPVVPVPVAPVVVPVPVVPVPVVPVPVVPVPVVPVPVVPVIVPVPVVPVPVVPVPVVPVVVPVPVVPVPVVPAVVPLPVVPLPVVPVPVVPVPVVPVVVPVPVVPVPVVPVVVPVPVVPVPVVPVPVVPVVVPAPVVPVPVVPVPVVPVPVVPVPVVPVVVPVPVVPVPVVPVVVPVPVVPVPVVPVPVVPVVVPVPVVPVPTVPAPTTPPPPLPGGSI